MRALKRIITFWLFLSMLGINPPLAKLCSAASLFAQADLDTITRHEPKIMSSPEQDIPMAENAET
jgi:hypothetical protein